MRTKPLELWATFLAGRPVPRDQTGGSRLEYVVAAATAGLLLGAVVDAVVNSSQVTLAIRQEIRQVIGAGMRTP